MLKLRLLGLGGGDDLWKYDQIMIYIIMMTACMRTLTLYISRFSVHYYTYELIPSMHYDLEWYVCGPFILRYMYADKCLVIYQI